MRVVDAIETKEVSGLLDPLSVSCPPKYPTKLPKG
jgi:hypothetical protein